MDGFSARWCTALVNGTLFIMVLILILWLIWLAGEQKHGKL